MAAPGANLQKRCHSCYDEVGHWYRMINGARQRNCNFNQVLIKSLTGDGWKATFDMQQNPVSYQQINDFFTKHGALNFVY